MMKLKNTVRICVEASITAISQHKEMFICGILSIDVGDGGERWKKLPTHGIASSVTLGVVCLCSKQSH